ncbi:hypothetical protein STEG23_031977 [Scotinomys teguina]
MVLRPDSGVRIQRAFCGQTETQTHNTNAGKCKQGISFVLCMLFVSPEILSKHSRANRIPRVPPHDWLWVSASVSIGGLLGEASLMTTGLGTSLADLILVLAGIVLVNENVVESISISLVESVVLVCHFKNGLFLLVIHNELSLQPMILISVVGLPLVEDSIEHRIEKLTLRWDRKKEI